MLSLFLLISRECAAFLVAALFIGFAMSAVYIDVNWMHNSLHENSFTELLQEVILAITTGLFFWSSVRRPDQRGGLILIGGFYLCMLIRELDDIFDTIRHGSWLWFALATTAICVFLSFRTLRSMITGLTAFFQHRTWLMTATGLIIVLVFSRLIGMHQLWEHLMLDGYNRVVKNMAEEASELMGYSVCFLSTVLFLKETREKV
ncbi:hypothetical protein IBT49_25215 [Erwinia sp. S63]|uniref:hypothetical protein n=1 Tax=Erwiniaceae TaxID=1903409 RepID=UPI00190A3553|nr:MULTISPECIES: hypothetical protein [Erwiniaceae]MBK0004630.1 hypothetical protein [Erwinia sp. S38]MBK0093635.1 hypothetical protein [Erwinia sp. S59]MBK0099305.1 hypothetical protein [Erwinia sp. S63]MBK0127295.1 hypothetical protein [Pantoea sp. S61]